MAGLGGGCRRRKPDLLLRPLRALGYFGRRSQLVALFYFLLKLSGDHDAAPSREDA